MAESTTPPPAFNLAAVPVKALATFRSRLVEVAEKAKSFAEVTNDEQLSECNTLIGRVRSALAWLKDARTKALAPLREEGNRVEAEFKPLKEAAEQIDGVLMAAASKYQQAERKRLAAEREAHEREVAEAERVRIEKAKEALRAQTAPEREAAERASADAFIAEMDAREAIAEIPKTPEGSTTEQGTLFSKEVWVFEVQKLEEVPREWLMLDTVKVRKAVAAGERNIPGLRIYPEEQSAYRRS